MSAGGPAPASKRALEEMRLRLKKGHAPAADENAGCPVASWTLAIPMPKDESHPEAAQRSWPGNGLASGSVRYLD